MKKKLLIIIGISIFIAGIIGGYFGYHYYYPKPILEEEIVEELAQEPPVEEPAEPPQPGVSGILEREEEKKRRLIEERFLKITDEEDWDKFFISLPLKEAKELLIQAENKGEFKFLFPPFKMPLGDEELIGTIFHQEDILFGVVEPDRSYRIITLIVISGLPPGTVFYAPSNAVARTIIDTHRENPYFLIRGEDIKYNWLFYIPGEPILEKDLLGSDETPKTISFGTPLARLETDYYLPLSLFGGGREVAFMIEKDKDATLADLKNVLTKDGKIVIVKDF